MPIPTEPIGSIPRPPDLIQALQSNQGSDVGLDDLFDAAVADTIARFEATGSPVVTDGEQRKFHNFGTYCVHGLPNLGPDGFRIPFAAGHTRRMPRLRAGPFRYQQRADLFLEAALRLSDIGMPERDGYQLIRDVRQLTPERGGRTPAIAITAFARSEDRTRAMLAGFQVHVAKPIEPHELVATVASLSGLMG